MALINDTSPTQVVIRTHVPVTAKNVETIPVPISTQNENGPTETNGEFLQVDNATGIASLYNKIFREYKKMYMVQYVSAEQTYIERELKVDVQTRKSGGSNTFDFSPKPS